MNLLDASYLTLDQHPEQISVWVSEAVQKVIDQGALSYNKETGACLYNSPEGLHCIVGGMISNEDHDKLNSVAKESSWEESSWEESSWNEDGVDVIVSMLGNYAIPTWLMQLQRCHDSASCYYDLKNDDHLGRFKHTIEVWINKYNINLNVDWKEIVSRKFPFEIR